jgi:hypothetical protein
MNSSFLILLLLSKNEIILNNNNNLQNFLIINTIKQFKKKTMKDTSISIIKLEINENPQQ